MTDNGRQRGIEENVNGCMVCKDWSETNISEGNTVHMQNHLSHHNDLIVKHELLFFSDGFKSIHSTCCVVGFVYQSIIYPAHASLISPLLTTVDPFLFRNTETQWQIRTAREKEKILNRKESLLIYRGDYGVKHACLSRGNTLVDAFLNSSDCHWADSGSIKCMQQV